MCFGKIQTLKQIKASKKKINEQQYDNLVCEVTKRVYNNQKLENEIHNKMFKTQYKSIDHSLKSQIKD